MIIMFTSEDSSDIKLITLLMYNDLIHVYGCIAFDSKFSLIMQCFQMSVFTFPILNRTVANVPIRIIRSRLHVSKATRGRGKFKIFGLDSTE